MLPTYHIYVDGKPYLGEDPEKTYPTDVGNSNGWHMHNHEALSILNFGELGDEPKEITGWRGLNGAIERISKRVTDGVLDFCRIEIINCSEFPKGSGTPAQWRWDYEKEIELRERTKR